jgi:hypothetical protein
MLRVRIAQSCRGDFRVFGVSRNDDVAFMFQHIFWLLFYLLSES